MNKLSRYLLGALAILALPAALFASAPGAGQVIFGPGMPVQLTGATPSTAVGPDVISDTGSARTAGLIHDFRNNGASKFSIDYLGNTHVNRAVAPVDCVGATLNITNAQWFGAGIFTCATAQTINMPSWQGAAGLVQNYGGVPQIGDTCGPFLFVATAANAITLGFGTGGTNGGGTATVLANTTRAVRCRVTGVTPGAETATCF